MNAPRAVARLTAVAALCASIAASTPRAAADYTHGVWSTIPPPTPRADHSSTYDPVRDRMIVFGGYDGAYRNDVWDLDLSGTATWTPLAPGGAAPPPRASHRAIYDPVRERMIVFGGSDGISYLNDVWALSLSETPSWTQLAPAGGAPSPRFGHSAIYDPVRDRMIVFGGDDGGLAVLGDCWALSLSGPPAWSLVQTSGTAPAVRSGHAAVYDPVRDRMIVFGGWDGLAYFNDTQALALGGSTWASIAASGTPPSGRSGHAAIYDPAGDRVVLFGGFDGAFRLGDTWSLSLGPAPAWSPVNPSGAIPAARSNHSATYDAARGRMVVFGGDAGSRVADVEALSLGPAPAWAELAVAAATPAACYRHAAIADPSADRMVVFGGYPGTYPYPDETWSLPLAPGAAWAPLEVSGLPPPGRYGHTAIHDPIRGRMVVFGGHDGTSRLDEVWARALSGSPAWTRLVPTGTPPTGRQNHSAIYDPVRDRMVVFGGDDLEYRNDCWALSLSGAASWTPLVPAAPAPPGRRFHTAVYDARRDRMVVFGGWNDDYRGDAAALGWGDPVRPEVGCPADRSATPGGVVEAQYILRHPLGSARAIEWTLASERAWPGFPAHGSVVVAAGSAEAIRVEIAVPDTAGPGADVLRFSAALSGAGGNDSICVSLVQVASAPLGVEVPGSSELQLDGALPNPATDRINVSFTLPRAGPVTLEAFDVGGRRVSAVQGVVLGAGYHQVPISPPQPLAPGVYVVRLTFGGRSLARRAVVLD